MGSFFMLLVEFLNANTFPALQLLLFYHRLEMDDYMRWNGVIAGVFKPLTDRGVRVGDVMSLQEVERLAESWEG